MSSNFTNGDRGRLHYVRRDRLMVENLRAGPSRPSRIYLTGSTVLNNNPRWQSADRYLLKDFLEGRPRRLPYTPNVRHRRRHLDAVIATIPEKLASIYRTRSSRTMIGLDADGTKLFEVLPGHIHLCMGIDETVMQFSTARW